MKPSLAIVGCGKVGTALAVQLARAGYTLVGLASRSRSSAEAAARKVGITCFSDAPWEVTRTADIVFITTPDGEIPATCNQIVDHDGFGNNSVVLHCSGAHPSTILSGAATGGADIGSMHPLQSFAAGAEEGNPFNGIVVSIEGGTKAVAAATGLATALGATCFTIKTEAKTLYHAAAVAASNYLVTVQAFAFQLLAASGIPEDKAFEVLGPLIRGTVQNIEKAGIVNALTGPIARGDVATITDHQRAITDMLPALLNLYQTLGRHTVPIAEAAGLSQDAVVELKKVLK